ncbi:hypothetical protein CPter91_5363 [Collimonas pratensis]|uniref:Uncharacterized protein n=1 Tax=Collimonas pratensis TaxID=279113 RepID=A0A127QC55_9BURK|nr:hypothetical protein CPter91_5363 [Collimonas pratensis]
MNSLPERINLFSKRVFINIFKLQIILLKRKSIFSLFQLINIKK